MTFSSRGHSYHGKHGIARINSSIENADDEPRAFVQVQRVDKGFPLHLQGHPFLHKADGVEFVYFGDPYP